MKSAYLLNIKSCVKNDVQYFLKTICLTLKALKLYDLVVLRLWDYAKTIFRSGKLQISYAKAEIGPKKTKCVQKCVQQAIKASKQSQPAKPASQPAKPAKPASQQSQPASQQSQSSAPRLGSGVSFRNSGR